MAGAETELEGNGGDGAKVGGFGVCSTDVGGENNGVVDGAEETTCGDVVVNGVWNPKPVGCVCCTRSLDLGE